MIFCNKLKPSKKEVLRFAVANAYLHWYDVPESEVLDIISKSLYYVKE